MVLFLLTAAPLFFAFFVLLPWKADRAPQRLFLGVQFLRGVLFFFPAWLILLLLRRIAGFSWSGFPLFLSILVHHHLAPALLAVGAFVLAVRKLDYTPTDEGVFLTALAILSGFTWMLCVADFVADYGRWDAHVLFLLPVTRLAAVLFLATIARDFERWEGRSGLLFSAAAAGTAVLGATASFLKLINRGVWGFAIAGGLFVAALVVAAARYPQVLREPRTFSAARARSR
jgi:hypothetical protein